MQQATCSQCGALMRADRPNCLRCGAVLREPVRKAVEASPSPSLPAWLQNPWLWAGLIVFGLVAVIALLPPVASQRDEVARPATPAGAAASRPQAGSSPAPAVTPPVVGNAALQHPVADASGFIESGRAGANTYVDGDVNAARERFQRAVDTSPQDPEALNRLALVLTRLGRIEEAVALLRRAVAVSAGTWTYHFNLGHALGLQGDWDGAVSEFRAAGTLMPSDYATQFDLGNALQHTSDFEGAIQAYYRAILAAPTEAWFRVPLADCLEAVGRREQARRELEAYLQTTPGAADAEQVKARIAQLAADEPKPPVKPPAP